MKDMCAGSYDGGELGQIAIREIGQRKTTLHLKNMGWVGKNFRGHYKGAGYQRGTTQERRGAHSVILFHVKNAGGAVVHKYKGVSWSKLHCMIFGNGSGGERGAPYVEKHGFAKTQNGSDGREAFNITEITLWKRGGTTASSTPAKGRLTWEGRQFLGGAKKRKKSAELSVRWADIGKRGRRKDPAGMYDLDKNNNEEKRDKSTCSAP